jgi:PAS domain S-box-containing protein
LPEIVSKSDDQKQAEAEVEAFRENLGPFVVAAETTRMPMVFTDARAADNPIIFANDSFLELSGYAREEVLGQSFDFLMKRPGSGSGMPAPGDSEPEGGSGGSDVQCRHKDGTEFWAALYISPVRDESGSIVQHFASFVDLTRHKQQLAQSEMLIGELNHRVKNTLATVQSIAWQALRKSSDPEVIREAIESRLLALSRSHDLLTRENWRGAWLRDVVDEALEPFTVAGSRADRIVVRGQEIRLPPAVALALGIAFNELATNAVKYGAFSNAAGSISIDWTVTAGPEGDRLSLTWQEKDGPPIIPPSRKGFGSRVIEHGLAHELDGTVQLEYRPGGVACTMIFPAPKGARVG